MEQLIIELINRFGYFAIFGLITLENLFPPIPSEVILTAGGFLTTCTSMSVLGVTIFSTAGSVLGAIVLYYVGRLLSPEKIIYLCQSRIGRTLHLSAPDILSSMDRFKKSGQKSVFFCRFIPIIRSMISIPAGMCKMDPIHFLTYTTLGSLGWNIILISLGKMLGEHRTYFLHVYHQYSNFIKILLFCFLVLWIWKTITKKTVKR